MRYPCPNTWPNLKPQEPSGGRPYLPCPARETFSFWPATQPNIKNCFIDFFFVKVLFGSTLGLWAITLPDPDPLGSVGFWRWPTPLHGFVGCALRFRLLKDFIPRLPLAADMPFLPLLHNLMIPGHQPTILGRSPAKSILRCTFMQYYCVDELMIS